MSESLALDRRGRGAYVRFYDLTGVTQIKPGDKLSYFDYVPSKTKMVFSRGLVSHDYLPLIDDSEASSATEDIFVSGLKDYRKHFGNKVISRQHATLRWKPTQQCPVLTDIGSTHGTYVHKLGKGIPFPLLPRMIKTMKEPTKLEKGDPNMLEDGDVIFLGKSVVSGSETYHPTSLFVKVVPEAKDHALATYARPKAPQAIDLDSGDEDKSGFCVESPFETVTSPFEKEEEASLAPEMAKATLKITFSEADSDSEEDDDDDVHVKSSEDPDMTMVGMVQGEEDEDSVMEDDESGSEAQGYSESEEDSESESECSSDGEASENGEEEALSDEKMRIVPGFADEEEEKKKMSKMEEVLDDVVDFLVGVNDAQARESEAGPFLAGTDVRETHQEDDNEASEHEEYTTSDHSQHGNKDDDISEASTAPTSDEEEASLTVKATNVVSASDVASEVIPAMHPSGTALVAGKKRSRDELEEEEEGEAPPTSDQPQSTSPAASAPIGYKKFKTFTAGVAAGFAAGVIGTFVGLSSLALNDASFV